MRILASLALLLAAGSLCLAQANPAQDAWNAEAKAVGTAGTLNADGSFRINILRKDVEFSNENGMPIPADLGLATYIAFSGTTDSAFAVGDVAMLSNEIDGVIDVLRAGGYEIVSLHNHMTTESPKLYFMHFQAKGKVSALSASFGKAVALLGRSKPNPIVPKATKKALDADALGRIFDAKPDVKSSGVIRFSGPRKDLSVTVDGASFLPGMGLASWAGFWACECGLTMVMGDTCCTRGDLQTAIDGLRKMGVHITAIHNHVFGANQEIAFMHYEGEGDALALAAGIKKVWLGLGK